ncbi:MAG: aminotransferase class III-fold pyridoxal phosphate-dependent enzyme, partial [Nocardioides sp.]
HLNPLVCDRLDRPDLVTMAKGLGGGIPIGACIALGDSADLMDPGQHGSTFGGNPIACAGALAVISTIESEDLLARSSALGGTLQAAARVAGVQSLRAAGSFLGIDLAEPVAATAVALAQDAGFLINNTGPSTIRLAPPLTVREDDIALFAEAWPMIVATASAGDQ